MQWYNSSFEEELQGTPLYNYIKQNCPKHWRRSLKYYQIITEKIVANPTEMLLPVIQKSGDKPLREIWNLVEEIKTDGGEILIEDVNFLKEIITEHYNLTNSVKAKTILDNLTLIPKKNCEKKFKEISDKHSPESILEDYVKKFFFKDDVNDTLERSGFGIYLRTRKDIELFKHECFDSFLHQKVGGYNFKIGFKHTKIHGKVKIYKNAEEFFETY